MAKSATRNSLRRRTRLSETSSAYKKASVCNRSPTASSGGRPTGRILVEAVDGLTVRTASYRFHDADGKTYSFLAPHVAGKVERSRSISGSEFDFLNSVTHETPKITLPSPSTMHFWGGLDAIKEDAYLDVDEFEENKLRLLVDVYRRIWG